MIPLDEYLKGLVVGDVVRLECYGFGGVWYKGVATATVIELTEDCIALGNPRTPKKSDIPTYFDRKTGHAWSHGNVNHPGGIPGRTGKMMARIARKGEFWNQQCLDLMTQVNPR